MGVGAQCGAFLHQALGSLLGNRGQEIDFEEALQQFHDQDEKAAIEDLRRLVARDRVLVQQSKRVACGDFEDVDGLIEKGGPVGLSLAKMTAALRSISEVCEGLANGDLTRKAEIQGDHDRLGLAVSSMVDAFVDTVQQVHLISMGNYATDIEPRSAHDQVGIALGEMTQTLRAATEVCDAIATGDLSQEVEIKSSQDTLGRAINSIVRTFTDVVKQADAIVAGDYSGGFQSRGEHDSLGIALEKMTTTLHDVGGVVEAVAAGDLSRRIEIDSKSAPLAVAINEMISSLQAAKEEADVDKWLKTGQTEVLEQIRGELDLTALSRNVVTTLTKYIGGQVGAMYVLQSEETLRLMASYGHRRRKEVVASLEFGEGLAGQVALEQETILVRDLPSDYIAVASSLGSASPRNLAISPFVVNGQVLGVIEIGSFQDITDQHLDLLQMVGESVAFAIQGAMARMRMAELIEEQHRQGETLKKQQGELIETNGVLEKQTAAMRESEERLRIQSDKLKLANDELEASAVNLRQQKAVLEEQRRTLQNQTSALKNQAEELKLANKYKSEFLSNMSHELRTPLNSMLILSKRLASNKPGNLSDKQVESAKVIHQGGQDLLTLINDILDLSKVEAGKMPIHVGAVSLREVASSLLRQFEPIASQRGIGFDVRIDEAVPELQTDRQRVTQVLKNLLSNACKFTSEGGVTLHVSMVTQNNPDDVSKIPGPVVAMRVIDTGVGIPEDKRRAIFEAFQQADGSTSRVYGGTGLGLAISREFASLLGGQLQLTSSSERGSVFSLYLPLQAPAHADVAGAMSAAAPTPTPNAPAQMPPSSLPRAAETRPAEDVGPSPSVLLPLTGPRDRYLADDRESITADDRVALIIDSERQSAKEMMHEARAQGYKCLASEMMRDARRLCERYLVQALIVHTRCLAGSERRVLDGMVRAAGDREFAVQIVGPGARSEGSWGFGVVGFCEAKVPGYGEFFARFQRCRSIDRSRKILVVDGEASIDALAMLVEGLRASQCAVSSVAEAKEELASSSVHVIVAGPSLSESELSALSESAQRAGCHLVCTRPVAVPREGAAECVPGFPDDPGALLDELTRRLLDARVSSGPSIGVARPFGLSTGLPARARNSMPSAERDDILVGKTVLVVDDDPRNIFALEAALDDSGLEILTAEDGQAAVQLLRMSPRVDIVLMDIMMPIMDGLQAMREIRTMPQFRALPVIALTAKAMPGDRKLCLQAGATEYLTKPVDEDRLLETMKSLLGRD